MLTRCRRKPTPWVPSTRWSHDSTAGKGHNTDVWGFQRSIQPFLMPTGTNAHSCWAPEAVQRRCTMCCANLALKRFRVPKRKQCADNTHAFGRPSMGYHELNANGCSKHHLLVVHCTPVGMWPNTKEWCRVSSRIPDPKPPRGGPHLHPSETLLLHKARGARCSHVLNGADMLRLQAEKAWEIWQVLGRVSPSCPDVPLMEAMEHLCPTEQSGPVDDLHTMSVAELLAAMHRVDNDVQIAVWMPCPRWKP